MKIKVILGTMQNASKLVSIAESISYDVDLCYGRYIVDARIHAWSLKPAGFCIWRIADSS
ncbi:MAG: hypothetical protein ACLTZM_14690 [Ruminococcus sp.]